MSLDPSEFAGQIDLELLTGISPEQTEPVDPDAEHGAAPGHTDLMVSPEAITEALGEIIPGIVAGTDLPIPTPPAKKGKKGAQILPPDPISQAAHQIEKLSSEAAMKMADDLLDGSEFNCFKLGGVFSVVNSKKYFADYGHADFKSWVETAYGFKFRKAMYLIQIYDQVLELNLTWDKIKHLGWTKLKTMLNPNLQLITADNLDEWVKKAEGMTVLQLESAVGKKKPGAENDNATEQDTNPTTKVSFALHADQKQVVRDALEKAKEMTGTASDTVALEMIAAEFLGNPTLSAHTSPAEIVGTHMIQINAETFKSAGYMLVLEAFEAAFPEIELEVKLPG